MPQLIATRLSRHELIEHFANYRCRAFETIAASAELLAKSRRAIIASEALLDAADMITDQMVGGSITASSQMDLEE